MKLTNEDKKILRSFGHPDSDFAQIEEAAGKTKYDLDGKRISRAKVIELIGRKQFLAGLSRSAFHWSAAQLTDDGMEIGFDSSAYFRDT